MTAKALSAKEADIVAHIRKHQPISSSQLALAFRLNSNTMGVHIQNLRNKGAIYGTGAGRWNKWSVTPPPKPEPPAPPPVSIDQVSSVWHWAERHARAA